MQQPPLEKAALAWIRSCVTVCVVLLPFPVVVLIYVRWARVVGIADYWYVASRRTAATVTVG